MASLSPLLSRLSVILFAVLLAAVSPAESQTCKSQKVTDIGGGGKAYADCKDLPALGAYLHYTYNATNSSLSVAFIAASTGWISWALNPTATGMVGAQALMALKPASGSIVAKTYNISSYHSIVESKLAFDVWDLKADEVSGTMRLFGSVKVPEGATSLNQVWQIGSAVNGTQPQIHAMAADNKNSKSTFDLSTSTGTPTSTSASGSSGAPTEAPAPAPASEAPRIVKATSGTFLLSLIFLCGIGF